MSSASLRWHTYIHNHWLKLPIFEISGHKQASQDLALWIGAYLWLHNNAEWNCLRRKIFIGPESDHCLCSSVTDWLTDWLTDSLTNCCLVNLIDVTLACEDGNSKLVVTVWLCLSLTDWLTHSLTHSCLVNLINVSLACEDGNSKLVEVYSATYSIQFLKVVKSFSRLESHS